MAIKAYKADDLPQGVKDAVTAGNVKIDETAEVEISEKAGKGKGGKRTYVKLVALNGKGMQALCGKIEPATEKPKEGKDERTAEQKMAGACDYFNYGYDLEVRASVRADLASDLEGPEKATAAAIKKVIDAGLMGRAEAIDWAMERATAQNKPLDRTLLEKALAA